jgi:hypothetical protein
MQDLLQNLKLEILPANPFLLRMAGFQALIDGWFSAPADISDASENDSRHFGLSP